MGLTDHKKRVKQRKTFVYDAYINKPDTEAVTCLVEFLAKKFKVSVVQIYNDIKEMKNGTN
jgi:ribosomal protein L31E